MSESPIRVIIADDHTIVRAGLRLLLDLEDDIDVVAEAVNGTEAIALTQRHCPHVVLMDIAMPETDGLAATKAIKQLCPATDVLILTMHRTDDYLFEVLRAGASGYVVKGAETNELVQAIRSVAGGQVYLHPSVAARLVQGYLDLSTADQHEGAVLSPREREIMRLIAHGYSNKEIAAKLVISVSTVYTHRSKVMQKLGLGSPRELREYARRNGLIRD